MAYVSLLLLASFILPPVLSAAPRNSVSDAPGVGVSDSDPGLHGPRISPRASGASSVLELRERAAKRAAAPYRLPPRADGLALEGLQAMYSLDYGEAERAFTEICNSMPVHPAGYLFLAGLHWWKRSLSVEFPGKHAALEEAFMDMAKEAITRAKEHSAWGGTKAERHFYLGGAYGMMGRWHAIHYHWIRAYFWGRKGYKRLKKAIKKDPEIYDAYLGLGMYDYYAGTIPLIYKIPGLIFVRGRRERGLERIDIAIKKGRYSATEARLFLVGAYSELEKKPEKTEPIIDKLKTNRPDNLLFRLLSLVPLLRARNWEKLLIEGQELLEKMETLPEHPIYKKLPVVYLYLANAEIGLRNPEGAIKRLSEGIAKAKDLESGWVNYSYSRRGQAYDLLGEREKAVADYKMVLEKEPFWYEDRHAKKGLKRPFTYEEVMEVIME